MTFRKEKIMRNNSVFFVYLAALGMAGGLCASSLAAPDEQQKGRVITVLSLAVLLTLPGGASATDDAAANPDSSVFIAEWPAYARDPQSHQDTPLSRLTANLRNSTSLRPSLALGKLCNAFD